MSDRRMFDGKVLAGISLKVALDDEDFLKVGALVTRVAVLEAAQASVAAKLFALDERVMLAESPRDLYDDVRDTLAGILITGELAVPRRGGAP